MRLLLTRSVAITTLLQDQARSSCMMNIAMTLRNCFATLLSPILLVSLLGCASTPRAEQTDELRLNELPQAGASTPRQEQTAESVDDTVLTTEVKEAILKEPSLHGEEISVETFKGTVQLSGFVSSIVVMAKAIEITRSVKGVIAVTDEMRLKAQH